jgi:hypothetical protein
MNSAVELRRSQLLALYGVAELAVGTDNDPQPRAENLHAESVLELLTVVLVLEPVAVLEELGPRLFYRGSEPLPVRLIGHHPRAG